MTPECSSVITINDPNRNLIVNTTNVEFKKGAFESKLQLPAKALNGIWTLLLICEKEVYN